MSAAKPIQREWILQRHVKLFAAEAIDAPHEFFAFDRGKAAGKRTHLYQEQRGVRAGTPDTLLRVLGLPPIWVELKRPGKDPTGKQEDVGKCLKAIGDIWDWADTVEGYCGILAHAGVALRPRAALIAMDHDLRITAAVLKAEQRSGTPSPPRSKGPRYTLGKRATSRARKAGILL